MFSHAAMACWGLLVSLRAASCTLCVRLTGCFSSKSSANGGIPALFGSQTLWPVPGRPRRRPHKNDFLGTYLQPLAQGVSGHSIDSYVAHRATSAARRGVARHI